MWEGGTLAPPEGPAAGGGRPPLRVCSLLPSATEIVGALGLGDALVAVSGGGRGARRRRARRSRAADRRRPGPAVSPRSPTSATCARGASPWATSSASRARRSTRRPSSRSVSGGGRPAPAALRPGTDGEAAGPRRARSTPASWRRSKGASGRWRRRPWSDGALRGTDEATSSLYKVRRTFVCRRNLARRRGRECRLTRGGSTRQGGPGAARGGEPDGHPDA